MDKVKTFALCRRMTLKNGKLSDGEKTVLKSIAEELELTEHEQLEARKILWSTLKTSDLPTDLLEKEELIRHMIRVGWADHEIHPSERQFLMKVGHAMDMDVKKINSLIVTLAPEDLQTKLEPEAEIERLRQEDFEAYMAADQAQLLDNSPGFFDDAGEDASKPLSYSEAVNNTISSSILGAFLAFRAAPFVIGVLLDTEQWQQGGEYRHIALIFVFMGWVVGGLAGSIFVTFGLYQCCVYLYEGLTTIARTWTESDLSSEDSEESLAPLSLTKALLYTVLSAVFGGFFIVILAPFTFGLLFETSLAAEGGEGDLFILVMTILWWFVGGLVGSILVGLAIYQSCHYFYRGIRGAMGPRKNSAATNP